MRKDGATNGSPRPQDVWSTMSAGSMPLHSMGGFSPPGGPGGGGGRPESLETEDYLEPTPPLQAPPIDPAYHQKREGRKPRGHLKHDLDSGVADVDGLHLAVDGNMNGIGPRVGGDHNVGDRMRRPDSLAVRGHEYEELPASRYQARYPYLEMDDGSRSGGSGGRPLPLPMVNELKSSTVHNDSTDSLCRPLSGTSSNGGGVHPDRFSNTYRKRENPLYDEGETDDLDLKSSKPAGLLACPCSGLIVVALVAIISFLLAILLIFGTFGSKKEVALDPKTAALIGQINQSELLTALSNMQRLEDKYNTLLLKMERLNSSVRQELNNLRGDRGTDSRLTRIEMEFSQKLAALGNNLTNQVQTASRIPGPKGDPGPPGAGDLSKCEYYFKRSGSPISALDTPTNWWPEEQADIDEWVITGLECTTEGGATSFLEIQPHSSSATISQYRCMCRGSLGSATSRFCKLNMWRCPRNV